MQWILGNKLTTQHIFKHWCKQKILSQMNPDYSRDDVNAAYLAMYVKCCRDLLQAGLAFIGISWSSDASPKAKLANPRITTKYQ